MSYDIVPEESLKSMQERGGQWFAWRNEALDSSGCGQFIFIQVGKDNTYRIPTGRAPDGSWGQGWKYLLCGRVDLQTGEIIPVVPFDISLLELESLISLLSEADKSQPQLHEELEGAMREQLIDRLQATLERAKLRFKSQEA